MKSLFILDNREIRRQRLVQISRATGLYDVYDSGSTSREDFEGGNFDVAIVHMSNVESPWIEDSWIEDSRNRKNAKLIIFSGGFSNDQSSAEGIEYVREKFLLENMRELIAHN